MRKVFRFGYHPGASRHPSWSRKGVVNSSASLLIEVCAGSIASSNGNAIVTPAPRRKVRLGMCFFVMNMLRLQLRRRILGSE